MVPRRIPGSMALLLLTGAFGACSSENTTETSSGGGSSTGGASTGGTSTGGAAGTATGGAAGTATGGAGGALGGAGGTDAGSSDAGDASAGGAVGCNNQSCLLSSGFCCFTAGGATCAVSGSKCDTGMDILCDGKDDCSGTDVCCRVKAPITSVDASTLAASTISCAPSCTNNNPPLFQKTQVCKTTSECLSGSCKPAPSGFPTGYSTCQ